MNPNNKRSFLLLAVVILGGCESATVVSGNRPEDRLNSKMPPNQKAAMIRHKQESGDLPTP